jgi:hypothetical protein
MNETKWARAPGDGTLRCDQCRLPYAQHLDHPSPHAYQGYLPWAVIDAARRARKAPAPPKDQP